MGRRSTVSIDLLLPLLFLALCSESVRWLAFIIKSFELVLGRRLLLVKEQFEMTSPLIFELNLRASQY